MSNTATVFFHNGGSVTWALNHSKTVFNGCFARFNNQVLCFWDNSGTAVSPLERNYLQVRPSSHFVLVSPVSIFKLLLQQSRLELNLLYWILDCSTSNRPYCSRTGCILFYVSPQRSEAGQCDAGQGRTHKDSRLWHVQRECVWGGQSYNILWDTRLYRTRG